MGDGEDDGVGGSDHELGATGGKGHKDTGGEEEEEEGGGKNVGPHLFCCSTGKYLKVHETLAILGPCPIWARALHRKPFLSVHGRSTANTRSRPVAKQFREYRTRTTPGAGEALVLSRHATHSRAVDLGSGASTRSGSKRSRKKRKRCHQNNETNHPQRNTKLGCHLNLCATRFLCSAGLATTGLLSASAHQRVGHDRILDTL